MSTQEEIDQQQELLKIYRHTLAHLLKQAAQYGGEVYAPPPVAHGIHEARKNIQRIKAILRTLNTIVVDQPDEDSPVQQTTAVEIQPIESDTTDAQNISPSSILKRVKAWSSRDKQDTSSCPYRGLSAFQEQHVPLFFGRETFTKQLVEEVDSKPLVAVIGPSGSGKSSVVFAGLIPHLRQDRNWLITSFRPGEHPFHSLAAVLIPLLEPGINETEQLVEIKQLAIALQKSDLTVKEVVERILQKYTLVTLNRKKPSIMQQMVDRIKQLSAINTRLLVIADQFEELYTLCRDSEERQSFLDCILAAVQTSPHQITSGFTLVITLRADFFGQALSYRPFADRLQYSNLLLGPMNRQELQAAIEQPARHVKLTIESGLTKRLLDAVSSQKSGDLPLLEFALTLLWERQSHHKLTHAVYDDIGGVEQALANYAERVFDELDDPDRRQVQHIFVQLVQPGEGTKDTRRRASRVEVGETNWNLVMRLADARLIVTGRDEATGEETVEVIHEALIEGWERLRNWMESDRAFRIWQEMLRTAIRHWEASNRDYGALLRGALLTEAEEWLSHHPDLINNTEKAFIETSREWQALQVATLESISDGVVVCREDDKILMMNRTMYEMLGWDIKNPIPNNFADLPIQLVFSNKKIISGNFEYYQIAEKAVRRIKTPVMTNDGHILGNVYVIHDISAEVAVNKAKTDFINMISMQLRTPLTPILGNIQLLLRGIFGEISSEGRDMLEQVRIRAEQMRDIVNNAIMVASIEANNLQTAISIMDIMDLMVAVERAAKPLRQAFNNKGLELRIELENDLPLVLADREHLQLVLTLLLDNACRYTHTGSVSVSATHQDGMVQLDITDTGPGIPAEEFGSLFTRFHRVDRNNSTEHGIGLGLAIARLLIERQGGQIWVYSEVGRGSTFSFSLLVANESAFAIEGSTDIS